MVGRTLFAIALTATTALALEFSRDTISAFDGRDWGGYRDDSTIVHNGSARPLSVDSIIVQFDTSAYDTFDVGWTERAPAMTFWRFHQYAHSPSVGSLDLASYNAGTGPRMVFTPGESRTWFSPYFSKTMSLVGVIVDCFGPCYPLDWRPHSEQFGGRIIFVHQLGRDTLHLLCLHEWSAPTKVVSAQHRVAAGRPATLSCTVDLTGRAVRNRPVRAGVVVEYDHADAGGRPSRLIPPVIDGEHSTK